MIQIYDINDNLIYEAPLTEGCERVQELMAADHIQLSFKAVHSFTIPAGAYIDWFGIYRLLEPYTPTQQSEAEYLYTPQFHAEHITWKKYPFFFYTDEKAEPDWSLTGNATLFLDCVTMALQKTFGQSWHYSVASDLPASAYVAFQNTDIFSGLNAIAEAFKTEWYADLTENRIYLGHVSRDEQAVLEVGKNVNVPSVTANSDAYFNRFYAFGSTRNIPQNYVGANTQNVVNKRLTLDPAKYPNGYKDIKDLKSGEDFATNLFFNNIYPRATEGTEGSKGLAISNVRERRLFKVERGTTNKIPTGETDENGNPIYEMYSIWYFNIASLEFSKSMIIEGTDLTCSFESGALQGREFVLGYHEEGQKLETADGTPFYVYAGDYEILYVEENGITIPTTGVGLIPADGDEVALFNLKLPDSYVEIAYKELEAALDEEIARRQKDYNSYTFKSNPVAFAKNNPNLYLGRAVKLINSGNALDTRITKLTYKLDSESPLFPNEMTITIGEKRIKGSIATLKEEVVNANRNIDLLAALNKQTTTIQEAYKRTQDAILQGFNRIANMWQFDDEGNVYSEFNVYTLKALSSKGISANEGGTGGTGIDIARMWEELASDDATKLINLSHMPSSVKTAVNWVSSVTSSDADSQINKWNEIVSFLSGISDTSSLSSILSGKANASAVEELSDDVSALNTHITNILARKVNAGTGLTGGGTLNADVTLSLATIGTAGTYTKVVVDAYGRVTGSSTLLESDIPYLSIAKISNLQSTIDTINGKFLNYLSLAGGKMANTNLVTNLNADLLDGYNADDLFKGRLKINSQISVSAEGWYTIASITTNGFNERGTIHFAIRTTGGDFRPYVTHYYINSSWTAGESNIFTNGIGGFITGIRLTQTGDSNAGGTRNIELCFSKDFTGYLIVLYSAYDNDGIINDNFTWNTGALPIADTSAEVWKTLDLWHGINTDKQIRTTNALYADSVVIGGVTLSWDYTNGMLKLDKGAYFLGPVSTKGVSNETGTGGAGVDLSAVWDSLANNTDAYGSTKIHIDHIPTLTTSKISDFPTLVSAFANDAGYITASAIINKADKATTLAGYGIADAVPFLNMVNASNLKSIGVGYVNANGANGENGGIISFGSASHQTQIHSDYSGGNIHWRVNSNGTLTNWKNLLDANNYSNYAVALDTKQTITGHKTFKNDGYYTSIFNSTLSDGKVRLLLMNNNEAKLMLAYDGLGSFLYDYSSAQTLKIQNDGDLLFTKSIIASSQLKSNVATGTAPLVVNSTTMVANLNANYLGGLNKDSFQKAVYDYVNVVGTPNDTPLPTVLAPSNYNGTNSIGGNFKYYDTKFYNGRSNTSNRCQLAYGYDVDSIHFRRYKDGTWYDWKKVVFTEGEDNIQVTNAYARFTANNGSLSGFFGFSGNVIGAYSNSLAEWLISASTSAICIAPQGKVNVGVKTWTPAYDFHVNGSIGANSLTIGQATISWDSANGMLKVDTGAYFTGPVSTKGVSGGSGLVAVAQFGITWHDAWAIDANSTYVESFGTTNKSISEGQGTTNGSTITIVSDAFSGKKIGDIEIFTLGWGNEAPANVRLAPYKISGNTLYCSLLLSGTMSQATFKIKIY